MAAATSDPPYVIDPVSGRRDCCGSMLADPHKDTCSSGREMTPLAARITAVKDELEALQREVEALPPFLGSFHAVNGLQQARTRIADCLYRLPKEASDA